VQAIERSHGEDSDLAAEATAYAADAYVQLGRLDPALAEYAHALGLMGPDYGEPGFKADTEFSLARALRKAKREPERAVELAQDARVYYAAQGDDGAKELKRIDAWLGGR
jgi:tetratricopeptide (TPR) repeat protein